MKCIHFLLASTMALSFHGQGLEAKSSKQTVKSSSDSTCDKFLITKEDVGHYGFEIKYPGDWVLAEDICYEPGTGAPAITICTSNVTLDLNDKTLSLNCNCADNVVGVFVKENTGNITIKNGTIRNFSRAGIFKGSTIAQTVHVQKSDKIRKQIKKNAANHIKRFGKNYTKNLSLQQCNCPTTSLRILNIQALCNGTRNVVNAGVDGMGGAVIFNTQDVLIENSSFLENAFSGLSVFNSTKVSIDNSHFDDNVSSYLLDQFTPYTAGAYFDKTNDLVIKNSTFNKNTAEDEAHGIRVNGNNIVIQDVQANDTSVSITDPKFATIANGGYVSGIFVLDSSNISVKNAQIWGYTLNTAQSLTTQNIVYNLNFGLDFSNSKSIDVRDCEIGGGLATNTSGQPVTLLTQSLHLFDCNRAHIESSHFFDNSNVSTIAGSLLLAQGCDIGSSEDVVIKDCFATGSIQTAPVGPVNNLSQASGFKVSGDSFRVFLDGCTAVNNIANGGDGAGYGFSTKEADVVNGPGTINIRFHNCLAEFNRGPNADTGCGFLLYKTSLCEVSNCTAVDNRVGIYVQDGPTENNQISNNTVNNNTDYGIFASSLSATNAYFSNSAKQNGGTPSQDNYRDSGPNTIFPDAVCSGPCSSLDLTPIRLWDLPAAPCAYNTNCITGDNLDNVSITN